MNKFWVSEIGSRIVDLVRYLFSSCFLWLDQGIHPEAAFQTMAIWSKSIASMPLRWRGNETMGMQYVRIYRYCSNKVVKYTICLYLYLFCFNYILYKNHYIYNATVYYSHFLLLLFVLIDFVRMHMCTKSIQSVMAHV